MKDISLMQITVLIPTRAVRDAALWLKHHGATQMMIMPHEADEPPRTRVSTAELKDNQQNWLKANLPKEDFKVREVIPAWVAAGFPAASIYAAITRAAQAKLVKKVKLGVYRRTSG